MRFEDYLLASQAITRRQYLSLIAAQFSVDPLNYELGKDLDDYVDQPLGDLCSEGTFPKLPFGTVLNSSRHAQEVYSRAGVTGLAPLIEQWQTWHRDACQPIVDHSTSSLVGRKLYEAEFEKRLVAQLLCKGKTHDGRRFIYDGDTVVLPEGSSVFYAGLSLAAYRKKTSIATSNQPLINEYFANPVFARSFNRFLTIGGYADRSPNGGSDQGAAFGMPAELAFANAIKVDPRATVALIPLSGITAADGPFATQGDVGNLKKKIIEKSEEERVRELVFICDWRKQLQRNGEGYGAPVYQRAEWNDLLQRNGEQRFLSLVTTPTPNVRKLITENKIDRHPYRRVPSSSNIDQLALKPEDTKYIVATRKLHEAFSGRVYEAIDFTKYPLPASRLQVAVAVGAHDKLREQPPGKGSSHADPVSVPHKRTSPLAPIGGLIGREEEVILETFVGTVERMDGGTANVTLVDQHGRETFAECSSADLTAKGITEGNRFKCVVRKRGDETVVTLERMPRRRLSEDEWREIQQDTAEALGDYDVTDDD